MIKKLALILTMLYPLKAEAVDLVLINHVGSFSGFTATGLGLESGFSNVRWDNIIGYTPAFIAGQYLLSATTKLTLLTPGSLFYTRPYLGLGMVVSLADDDTFYTLPEQYPNKYYPPTGYLFMPYMGLDVKFSRNFAAYIEAATLDYYAEAWYRSEGKLNFSEMVSLGFGLRIFLR
jgi:hypothetical protein